MALPEYDLGRASLFKTPNLRHHGMTGFGFHNIYNGGHDETSFREGTSLAVQEAIRPEQEQLRATARWMRMLHAPHWAELAMCFGLGLILSAARVANAPAPFGTAILTALGYGAGGFLCLLGCMVGYFAGFGFLAGTQMSCGCVLVFIVSYFLRENTLYRTRWFPALLACTAYGLTRLSLYLMTGGISVPLVVRMGFYLLLCAAAVVCDLDVLDQRDVHTPTAEIWRSISTVFALACVLMGLSRFLLFRVISVGRILSQVVLLILCATGGPLCGSAAGVVIGVSMDVSVGGNAYFTAAYPIAALLAGLFNKHHRAIFLTAYLITQALVLFCLPAEALRMPGLIEASVSSIAYLLVPQSFVVSLGSFVQPQRAGRGESGLRRYTAGQVGSMSHAYRALYDVAQEATARAENDEDPSKIFDRTADRVCVSCQRRSVCWGRNSADTLSALHDAEKTIRTRGRLTEEDFPKYFRDQCPNLRAFSEVANGELRLKAFRRQMQGQLQEERALLWEQYRDFSEVLGASARALGSVYGGDPTAERRLIRYLRTLGVEADASVFRDSRGRLHAAIESRYLEPLLETPDYLDGLSAVLGVRLCMPEHQMRQDSIVLLEAEPLSASVGIAAVKKQGERVSGDRGTYFKTDGGELCVILSDGMGTGDQAAEDSIGTIRILENFLRAGVSPSNAMKLLNSAALVRSEESWGYATVDLVCIDLFTGDACFYKYGAAPSYVKTGGVIRKVRSASYAAGLKYEAGRSPDTMRMRLKPGSVAVIASDGVVSDGEDLWLRKLIEETDGADMKSLAGSVIQSAIREYGRNDDMTALAIKVEVRT